MDPLSDRRVSFLFVRCQTQLDAGDLVVAVPAGSMCRAGSSTDAGLAWDDPVEVPNEVVVECAPGPRRRTDHAEYAGEQAYADAAEFRFRGAVSYGRVPTMGGWALCVQGAVRSLSGLDGGWEQCDAVMVSSPELQTALPPGDGGPVNGPHLPWP